MSTTTTGTTARPSTPQSEQRSRWSRFLDAIAPAPSPHRLVTVAEVSRDAVRFVEESLVEVGLPHVVQQVGSMPGTATRFRVLVPAKDRELATQLVGSF